jgi:hypothetical protein
MKTLVSLLTAALLSLPCLALGSTEPKSCPDVATIKAQGIKKVGADDTGTWFGFAESDYNTDHDWGMFLGPLQATDESAARAESEAVLPKLSGKPRPSYYHRGMLSFWYCKYTIPAPYQVVTVAGENKLDQRFMLGLVAFLP